MKLAFVGSGEQVVFLEMSEDFLDMFLVLFHVVGVNEDVVQVY